MTIRPELLADNPTPFEDGDAGIIIKPDGSIQMFNRFGAKDERDYSPAQLETGKKLIALTVALKVPTIMSILLQMASDPDINGTLN